MLAFNVNASDIPKKTKSEMITILIFMHLGEISSKYQIFYERLIAHETEWKTGYYDIDTGLFAAKSSAGQIITVINNVSKSYINNLRELTP